MDICTFLISKCPLSHMWKSSDEKTMRAGRRTKPDHPVSNFPSSNKRKKHKNVSTTNGKGQRSGCWA
jgi:hypothetical protein